MTITQSNTERPTYTLSLASTSWARRREIVGAALLTASLFLLLAGYYLLKTVREALILVEGGAEVKSYAAAGQAMLLLLGLPVFGWVARRIRGFQLVRAIYLFFAANLALFYLFGRAGVSIAVPFYLWLGIFSVQTVALFWSYSNDVYTEEQGRRLFPIIGIGAAIGGVSGSRLAKMLVKLMEPHSAMLVGGLLLIASLAVLAASRRFPTARASAAPREARTDHGGGFRLIASSKYLMLIAAMVVLTNVVNTTGEFIIGKTVLNASKTVAVGLQKQYIGGFYADYYMMIGLVGLLVQVLVVSPIFRKIGVGGAILILPVVALTGYTAMAILPAMWLIRSAKIAENSLDYSLQNTAKHALFLPTNEETKYLAKGTIDTFFFRFGDMVQAGIVLLGSSLSFSLGNYALLNVAAALAWLGVSIAAAFEYRRKTTLGRAKVEAIRVRPVAPATGTFARRRVASVVAAATLTAGAAQAHIGEDTCSYRPGASGDAVRSIR